MTNNTDEAKTDTGADEVGHLDLGPLSAVSELSTRWVDELRDEITIMKIGDKVQVFSSICPHFGGEFNFNCKTKRVRCKWHDWKYCTKTGKCLSYPIKGVLKPYDLEIKPNNLKKYEYAIENQNIFIINKGS